jgi:prepilin-type N-terminal cleavage/methylation domain-containing protein
MKQLLTRVHGGGGKAGRAGMTLLETIMAIAVITILAAGVGGLLAALARQTELNRQMAVVNSEVSNALSLVHSAPYQSIGSTLVADGYVDRGNFSYRKDLSAAPLHLASGTLDVTFRNVVAPPALPDPLRVDVVIRWDCPPMGQATRSFVNVRTR